MTYMQRIFQGVTLQLYLNQLLHYNGKKIIRIDAGFDTNWDFVGDGSGDVYDVITNPENCVVNIVSKIDHT